MISAKYNTPPPQKKIKTNKQKANKAKQNKQTNKQTKAKTKNMWGFVFPKCCSHQSY